MLFIKRFFFCGILFLLGGYSCAMDYAMDDEKKLSTLKNKIEQCLAQVEAGNAKAVNGTIQNPFGDYTMKQSPLCLAVEYFSNSDLIERLLKAGADPYVYCGLYSPITQARNAADIQRLINPSLKNCTKALLCLVGKTCKCTKEERMKAFTWLLQQGANPNEKMNDSSSLRNLFVELLYPNDDVQEEIKLFIEYGANPKNDEDESAYTLSKKWDSADYRFGCESYTPLMEKEYTNYKNKMKCLRLLLAGNYRNKKSNAQKNPDSLFVRLPIPIIKEIGLYVLGRVR